MMNNDEVIETFCKERQRDLDSIIKKNDTIIYDAKSRVIKINIVAKDQDSCNRRFGVIFPDMIYGRVSDIDEERDTICGLASLPISGLFDENDEKSKEFMKKIEKAEDICQDMCGKRGLSFEKYYYIKDIIVDKDNPIKILLNKEVEEYFEHHTILKSMVEGLDIEFY